MNVIKNHFSLLKSIPREKGRKILNLNKFNLPFFGQDIWTLYELSWLNKNGLPQIAIAKIEIDAFSMNIVESKSLKMYINSFNQIKFSSCQEFVKQLEIDLSKCINGKISITTFTIDEIKNQNISKFNGHCIDYQTVNIKSYQYNKLLLKNSTKQEIIKESLYSNLFKSNCPITHQPDWASIQIIYSGKAIDHAALLIYLVSFRNFNEFHEECTERIFNDIQNICQPEKLTIYIRYTRRGGIDINPWRSNNVFFPCLTRMARQ